MYFEIDFSIKKMTVNNSIPQEDWYRVSNQDGFLTMETEYGFLNLSDLLESISQEHDQYSMDITVYAIILVIVTYLVNFSIIVIILSEKDLRCQSMYICIVNYCVVNLLFNFYVTPLAVYTELQQTWDLGSGACKAWIIMDVLLPFISFLVFILMIVDRFFLMWKFLLYSRIMGVIQNIIYVMFPWLLGSGIILPLWIYGEKVMPDMEGIPGICMFALEFQPSVASPLLSYFVPMVFVLTMMVIIVINNFRGTTPDSNPYLNSVTSRSADASIPTTLFIYEDTFPLSTLYLANCFFIVMWFPHQFVSLLLAFCQSCYPPYSLILGFTWLGATASALVPLVWFLDSRIRRRVRTLVCKLFTKRSPSNPEGTDVHLMEM